MLQSKIYWIYFIFILFFVFSCKNNSDNKNFNDSLKIDISSDSVYYNDSVSTEDKKIQKEKTISDTQVVFFMPSPKERQNLLKFYGTYSQYEFQAIINNFLNLSRSVNQSLSYYNIPVEVCYSKKFIFPFNNDTLIYDLMIENQIMGYIIADGKNYPLIRNGVQKSKTISNDIRNYFNIASYNLIGN